MASEVGICNLALSHLGNANSVTSIDPPDGTKEADDCKQFYPIARDACLERHAWGFAVRRIPLAAYSENPVSHWLFAYAMPPNCVKPLAVLPPESTDDNANTQDFTVESRDNGASVLYTNQEDAVLKYVAQVTDTTKFTPLFVVALSRLLASFLAGPVIKGEKGMRIAAAQLKFFEDVALPQAAGSEAQGQKNTPYGTGHTPDFILVRR